MYTCEKAEEIKLLNRKYEVYHPRQFGDVNEKQKEATYVLISK